MFKWQVYYITRTNKKHCLMLILLWFIGYLIKITNTLNAGVDIGIDLCHTL